MLQPGPKDILTEVLREGAHAACSIISSSFAFAARAHGCHFRIYVRTPPTYTSSGVTGSPPASGTKAQCGLRPL